MRDREARQQDGFDEEDESVGELSPEEKAKLDALEKGLSEIAKLAADGIRAVRGTRQASVADGMTYLSLIRDEAGEVLRKITKGGC